MVLAETIAIVSTQRNLNKGRNPNHASPRQRWHHMVAAGASSYTYGPTLLLTQRAHIQIMFKTRNIINQAAHKSECTIESPQARASTSTTKPPGRTTRSCLRCLRGARGRSAVAIPRGGTCRTIPIPDNPARARFSRVACGLHGGRLLQVAARPKHLDEPVAQNGVGRVQRSLRGLAMAELQGRGKHEKTLRSREGTNMITNAAFGIPDHTPAGMAHCAMIYTGK